MALGNFVNGIWMLYGPNDWYVRLPGRVPDFGPMNEHFVRDLGCVFVALGVVSVKGALEPAWRKGALFVMQLWFVPHAAVHLFDTIRGHVALEHLYIDIPLCYGPPLLIGFLQFVLRCESSRDEMAP